MSYQVLARKWRPKSFATLIGQEHVVRALTHALDQQRLHHAYLFTGTRGVGKTTIARIMAKALNCETGITSTPCGTCSSCVEIDGGRFIDYIELDAASNRGVEDMTGLLDKATYAPTRGRFKVYVIDEVHQLTGHAFNAMLKTLEEPPEHVKFILATTDPQKIPITVLSRCLQFNLKQMPQQSIIDHLSRILDAESVKFEAPALRHLAKAAAGSMRDALSLLDQAIAHGAGVIEEEKVRDMLGTVGDDYLYALLDALVARDVAALIAVADQMETRSLNFDSALQELAVLFHRIALLQFAPEAMGDSDERERLKSYAAAFDAEFLQLCYQIAIHGRDDLALAPDEYAGFTMALLRMVAFNPETASARPADPTPAPARPAPVAAKPAPAQAAVATPPAAQRQAAPAAPAVSDDWHGIVAALSLSGMARQLAQHCELVEVGEAQITLHLPPAHKHLLARTPQDKLQTELQAHYGRPLKLNINIAAAATETPAERAKNARHARQEQAIAAIEGDSFVREVVEMFDASIDESTIKPI
ncbi:DNA polymerase III subunits gamma and tau [Georgfuchsia toluolica]|uniref:DNA polymerase III subunit gamma/tau n=1 Tax=Georgfuchsia toluolica TaxID=424218 RepID=A0A916J1X3_9PROT|nr:DNA polymerase III subunit gamma/tau [Georgfuchsia toluolica]CAG4883174.1 DNA polymerase III subunits gamma and tau [Georgfuchsia toluolica]